MDWARAIDHNRDALKAILASLFVMLGLDGNASLTRIPKPLHRAVLRLLMPAESALRRLIIIVARGLVVTLPPSRPRPAGLTRKGKRQRRSFQLFDSRKRSALVPQDHNTGAGAVPRSHVSENDPRVAAPGPEREAASAPKPDDSLVDAQHLCRRLQTLKLALDDLPRQAKRLARWRARREKLPNPKFKLPLRPGPAPGQRRKLVHEVDFVLHECHGLAWDALRPDTS